MTPYHTVILTGFMGSGKSTIGPLLAQELGFTYLDTDHEIETTQDMSIATIFDTKGEPYFRDQETQYCSQLSEKKHHVIATGGGMITSETNWKTLTQIGPIVFLWAAFDTILSRLKETDTRPLFTTENNLSELYQKRNPIYQSRSDYVINTDTQSPQESVQEICRMLHTFEEIRSS